jgi:tetratricopeptide (TPR) repeat protein
MPALDRVLMTSILEEARSAGNGLTDGMRHDLAWITLAHPFTNEAYEAIEVLVAGAPGAQERDRIDAVCRWARGYEGGRMGSNIVYYAAYRCYRLMDYDRALEYAGQCEEQNIPYKDRVVMLRALCRVGQNRTEEALQELQNVQTNYPDSAMVPQAIFFTGWIRMRSQKVQEAAAVFRELVAKYPNNSYADKARQILDGM